MISCFNLCQSKGVQKKYNMIRMITSLNLSNSMKIRITIGVVIALLAILYEASKYGMIHKIDSIRDCQYGDWDGIKDEGWDMHGNLVWWGSCRDQEHVSLHGNHIRTGEYHTPSADAYGLQDPPSPRYGVFIHLTHALIHLGMNIHLFITSENGFKLPDIHGFIRGTRVLMSFIGAISITYITDQIIILALLIVTMLIYMIFQSAKSCENRGNGHRLFGISHMLFIVIVAMQVSKLGQADSIVAIAINITLLYSMTECMISERYDCYLAIMTIPIMLSTIASMTH